MGQGHVMKARKVMSRRHKDMQKIRIWFNSGMRWSAAMMKYVVITWYIYIVCPCQQTFFIRLDCT